MITRALRFCGGTLTASRAILVGAVALVIVPFSAGAAFASHVDVDTPEIVVQPSTTQAGTAMTPTVQVDVTEPHGTKPDPDFNGQVTLTYAVNPDGAPEPTGNVAKARHGVARFPGLTFSAVGFGFKLIASIPHEVNAQPSDAFDIVSQLVTCQPGLPCQSGTVSSDGTSGSSVAAPGLTTGFLAATGGGFPALSCTMVGGVLTFSASSEQVISIRFASPAKPPKHRPRPWPSVCWGAPGPFVTADGTTSVFNPVNGDYEGLLPSCGLHLLGWTGRPPPCVLWSGFGFGHHLAARVLAPAGDPHITF
jgi:hypothetical protein